MIIILFRELAAHLQSLRAKQEEDRAEAQSKEAERLKKKKKKDGGKAEEEDIQLVEDDDEDGG